MLVVLFALTGCARITYKDPQGGEISYSRFWNQELVDVKFKKTKDGLDVQVGGQKGGAGDLAEALKNMSEVTKKIAGLP